MVIRDFLLRGIFHRIDDKSAKIPPADEHRKIHLRPVGEGCVGANPFAGQDKSDRCFRARLMAGSRMDMHRLIENRKFEFVRQPFVY